MCVCVSSSLPTDDAHTLVVNKGPFFATKKKNKKLKDGPYLILAASAPVSEKRVWEDLTGTTENWSESEV